jgi:hypothetical protein
VTTSRPADSLPDLPSAGYRARLMRDPGQQRQRRDLRPTPAASAGLAARLTARDRWLLWMLAEHRVLTTSQVTQLAFGSARQATGRLRVLHQLGVLDRFRPYTAAGSAPLHYVLAPLGGQVLADDHHTTVDAIGYRPEQLARLAVSLHLAHDVGANSVFTALAAHARTRGASGHLTAWWSEARCRLAWDGLIRPDGYGRWQPAPARTETTASQATGETAGQPVGRAPRLAAEVDFFLEYDTGTEHPDRVSAKLASYAQLALVSGLITPVLFWLPHPRRETRLRAALTAWLRTRPGTAPLVPIATTHATLTALATVPELTEPAGADPNAAPTAGLDGPAGAVWLPLVDGDSPHVTRGPERLTLSQLRHIWPPPQPVHVRQLPDPADQLGGQLHSPHKDRPDWPDAPTDPPGTTALDAPDPHPPATASRQSRNTPRDHAADEAAQSARRRSEQWRG